MDDPRFSPFHSPHPHTLLTAEDFNIKSNTSPSNSTQPWSGLISLRPGASSRRRTSQLDMELNGKKLQAAEKPESVRECHGNGQAVIEILHPALLVREAQDECR